MPRFSIVIPAYQAAATLPETLDSVLAQEYADFECIVVDDGASDETPRIAEEYSAINSRLRVIHQSNQGTAAAYNSGVASATGDYVVILSADDLLLPTHLLEMTRFMGDEPDYQIYSSNGFFLEPNGSRQLCYEDSEGARPHSFGVKELADACFYSVGAVYERGLFDLVGGYRTGIFGEDYDFWLRAVTAGARHRYLPLSLSVHRHTSTQKSADLEASYRSDIRILTDLKQATLLSSEDSAAVDRAIRNRLRLIHQLHVPWMVRRATAVYQRVGSTARRGVVTLVGQQRARRLKASLKSRLG